MYASRVGTFQKVLFLDNFVAKKSNSESNFHAKEYLNMNCTFPTHIISTFFLLQLQLT